ncbi:MAG: peptidase M14 [Ignavibacteriales bacterium]|nr:peptidase M14 [Ignavibacteriales bacterium]
MKRSRNLFVENPPLFFLLTTITFIMTTHAQPQIARELFDRYDKDKHESITSRRFTQSQLLEWLKPYVEKNVVAAESLGTSAEGRTISLYTFGAGPTKVFLWSQMHGDEATATMALVDMFNFFSKNPDHAAARALREKLTLLVIPMLNPDGAERFTRRTGQLIDMNRDALALVTPEAKILKATRERFQPEFGFNLHDQDPRYTVGATKNISAIALLAPATNEERSDNAVRLRAKKVAASLAEVMRQFIPAHLAKWDDAFEPRAFGDNIQKWGTSTVLIESGGWLNDPDKMFLRKLNYVGLLTTLYAIATETIDDADIQAYEQIPFNTKYAFDLLIRNAQLKMNDRVPAVRVDVGVNFEEMMMNGAVQRSARIMDVGDLSIYTAYEVRDAKGGVIDTAKVGIERVISFDDLNRLINP